MWTCFFFVCFGWWCFLFVYLFILLLFKKKKKLGGVRVGGGLQFFDGGLGGGGGTFRSDLASSMFELEFIYDHKTWGPANLGQVWCKPHYFLNVSTSQTPSGLRENLPPGFVSSQ